MHRRPPWYLTLPAIGTAVMIAMPIVYLVSQVVQAGVSEVAHDVLRPITIQLLFNTLILTLGVVVLSTMLAVPIAYLTTQTDVPARGLFTLVGVLPLAVPSYIMAYAMCSFGDYGGPWHTLTGVIVGRPHGYWAAVWTLGIYNMPYMYLSLKAALRGVDPSMVEAGRSLGHGSWSIWLRVVLPQLGPGLMAGIFLVGLHVIGDFGVVSLLRYETLSYALYNSFEATDLQGAASSALILIALALVILLVDLWILRGLTLYRTTAATPRPQRATRLGRWKWLALGFLVSVCLVSVVWPTSMIMFWMFKTPFYSGSRPVLSTLVNSLTVSMPAALCAGALALPIAVLARRYPSRSSLVFERFAFMSHTIPALAFALALIFLSSRLRQYSSIVIYPSFGLLILAYTIHFLTEALGPIRSGLYVATPRLEEASRGLGVNTWGTMLRITLPMLRPSLAVAVVLVFLSVMKELPLTMLLKPYNFNTLASQIWDYSDQALYADAAPYALCILLASAAFVGVILMGGRQKA